MKLISNIIIVILIFTGCNFNNNSGDNKEVTTLIFVRHAEKSEGKNPELTDVGKNRALNIGKMFKDSGIVAVYSTDYKRTVQTATPLSKNLGLPVKKYNPSDKDFVKRVVQNHKGKTIFIVGHSNTVPRMINSINSKFNIKQLNEKEFSKVFIVKVYGYISDLTMLNSID